MGKSLFLITNSFPFGMGESFLEAELQFLAQKFEHIYIIPNKKLDGSPRKISLQNVYVLSALYKTRINSVFHILFNNCGFKFIIEELKSSCNSTPFSEKLRCIIVGLKTRSYSKLLKQKIKKCCDLDDSILYFYWGNIPANSSILLSNNIKCVIRYHGGDLYEELPVRKKKIFYRRMLLESASLNVFISIHGYEYIKTKYTDIKMKHLVSRLGVFDMGYSRKSDDNVIRILSCSNVTSNKRVHLIVEALRLIKTPVIWTHIGDGPLLNKIKKISNNLPANIQVNLIGHISNPEVRIFFIQNMVDVFINVSESEGVPVSVMESLSAGVPVIATNVGGTSEIVDTSVGYLIDKNISIEELANVLDKFYQLTSSQIDNLRRDSYKRFKEMADAPFLYSSFATQLCNLT